MPFHPLIRSLLEYYTTQPPAIETRWYGPWYSILTQLFPLSEGYVISPRRHLCDHSGIPRVTNFSFVVMKLSSPPLPLPANTVLVVTFRNPQAWERGIPAFERQLRRQTDASFTDTEAEAAAQGKVYWIGVIGPHWRYGEKEEGEDVQALIDWHHTTHDEASFEDFQVLVGLVSAL